MIIFLEVAGGLLLLFVGGELLVRGAVALARQIGVSPLIVGLTVVSAGTSAPELVVSLIASLEGSPGIAVGNVVGSNIANILMVLGAAALIYPIARNAQSVTRDGAVFIATSGLFALLCLTGQIERWHGIVMVAVLAAYIFGSYWLDRRNVAAAREIESEVAELAGTDSKPWMTLGKLVLGLAGVLVGAELIVDGALDIARAAGIDETIIGLTLVALGTSLPEVAASVIAARRKAQRRGARQCGRQLHFQHPRNHGHRLDRQAHRRASGDHGLRPVGHARRHRRIRGAGAGAAADRPGLSG